MKKKNSCHMHYCCAYCFSNNISTVPKIQFDSKSQPEPKRFCSSRMYYTDLYKNK